MKGLSLKQWQQAGAFFINEGKNIVITFLAAKAVIDGQMTLGAMLAVQYIIGQLNSPVEQMIGFVQSWQNAKISMDRLNEIHTMEDEEPEDKQFQYTLPAALAMRVVGGTARPLQTPPVEGLFRRTKPRLCNLSTVYWNRRKGGRLAKRRWPSLPGKVGMGPSW